MLRWRHRCLGLCLNQEAYHHWLRQNDKGHQRPCVSAGLSYAWTRDGLIAYAYFLMHRGQIFAASYITDIEPSGPQNRERNDLKHHPLHLLIYTCLLYTSDAADERSSVDLGG